MGRVGSWLGEHRGVHVAAVMLAWFVWVTVLLVIEQHHGRPALISAALGCAMVLFPSRTVPSSRVISVRTRVEIVAALLLPLLVIAIAPPEVLPFAVAVAAVGCGFLFASATRPSDA